MGNQERLCSSIEQKSMVSAVTHDKTCHTYPANKKYQGESKKYIASLDFAALTTSTAYPAGPCVPELALNTTNKLDKETLTCKSTLVVFAAFCSCTCVCTHQHPLYLRHTSNENELNFSYFVEISIMERRSVRGRKRSNLNKAV